jgi:hemerythrin-like domain-containing protein
MALAHNGIIRGLNSIYLQAPHIPRSDLATIRDFLTYCQCWCESMHHHHDAEETVFFPTIEQITNIQGIMERNIEQHRAFTPGFEHFQEYTRTCAPKDYDGGKLRSLVEAFAEPLTRHLYDEIDTLRGLDAYDNERIRQAYKRFEKELMATDNVRYLHLAKSNHTTDSVLVSNRPHRVRYRGPKLRRRHA